MEKEIGVTDGREGERARIRGVGGFLNFFYRFPNPYVSYVSSSQSIMATENIFARD